MMRLGMLHSATRSVGGADLGNASNQCHIGEDVQRSETDQDLLEIHNDTDEAESHRAASCAQAQGGSTGP